MCLPAWRLPRMERTRGVEPPYPDWKSGVLPLNYIRREKGWKMILHLAPAGVEPVGSRTRTTLHIFAGPSRTDSPLCRPCAVELTVHGASQAVFSSRSLSFFPRPTRTGGTSAGVVRGIGCSPRDAVIRPVNPLCTVFPLYAVRPSVPAYRYSRVATPCRSAGIEPAHPFVRRRSSVKLSAAYCRRRGPAPL